MKVKLFLLLSFYLILTAATCNIKPCDYINCPTGYHCENGVCVQDPVPPSCDNYTCNEGFHCELVDNVPTCVQNPPPEDPCQNISCEEGFKCVLGKCVPLPDPCDGVNCQTGYHCEKGNCVPDSPVPENPCPKVLAQNAVVYMNNKPYGNGFDSTVRVKGDPEFCRLIHGETVNDCHLEGWPKGVECEYFLLGGNCPVWQFSSDTKNVIRCHDDHYALASCDHFGNPMYRDDPQTPTTGDNLENLKGFEGEPKVCGLHRDSFGPYQGFFTIAHGKGYVRSCVSEETPNTCGPWKLFER